MHDCEGFDDAASGDWFEGTLVDDFLIHDDGPVTHVLNAPSPAATASLAIGERLATRVLGRLVDI